MAVGGWFRRHKLVIAAICFIATIVFVPMFPYFPDCDPYPYAVYNIHLSDRYRVELTGYLETFQVHHIAFGDVVFLTFWDWLNDPDDWVLNASNKAVLTLTDRGFNPRLEDPPDHIKALVAAARDSLDCELVRAVAIEGW